MLMQRPVLLFDSTNEMASSFRLPQRDVVQSMPQLLGEFIHKQLKPSRTWVGHPTNGARLEVPMHWDSDRGYVPGRVVAYNEAPVIWDMPTVAQPTALARSNGIGYLAGVKAFILVKFPTCVGEWVIVAEERRRARAWSVSDVELIVSAANRAAPAVNDFVFGQLHDGDQQAMVVELEQHRSIRAAKPPEEHSQKYMRATGL